MINFLGELITGVQLPGDFYWPPHVDDHIPFSEQFVLSRKDTVSENRWIVACQDVSSHKTYPLIWKDKQDKIEYGFDHTAWFDWVVHENYRREHSPSILNKLPFHYHTIPGPIRNTLLQSLLTFKSFFGSSNRTFPVSVFSAGVDILARLSKSVDVLEKPVLVLTHDIDTKEGFDHVETISRLEEKYGFRSSWNIVPKHYLLNEDVLFALKDRGHEIGLHGIWHNNREAFLSDEDFRREMDSLQPLLKKYEMRGYRSPSWYRTQKMYNILAEYFMYDLSSLDNDTICPAGKGGTGMIRPFKITPKLIELSCTLPFEVPLFSSILPRELIGYWKNKIDYIYQVNGMLLINTHPDPNYLGQPRLLHEYENLLKMLHQAQWSSCLPVALAERYHGN